MLAQQLGSPSLHRLTTRNPLPLISQTHRTSRRRHRTHAAESSSTASQDELLFPLPQTEQLSPTEALKEHKLGFGFSAGGLLFPYYQGIVEGLQEEELLQHDTPVAGASAGSLIAACAKSGLTSEELLNALLRLASDLRRLGTRANLGPCLRTILLDVLPEDIHLRCSGSVHIAVSKVFPSRLEPVLVNSYTSRDDLIEALMTSCHIPWYFNGNLTTQFRGEAHFDGGISNFLPRLPNVERNVGVCCFPAGQMGALSSRVQLAPDTFEPWPYGFRKMLAWALTPAPDEMMVSLMEKGKRDSLQWCKEYKESLLILPLPEEEQPAGSGVILPSSSSTVPANSSVEP